MSRGAAAGFGHLAQPPEQKDQERSAQRSRTAHFGKLTGENWRKVKIKKKPLEKLKFKLLRLKPGA